MKRAFIFLTYRTPEWVSRAYSVSKTLEKQGYSSVLVDVTDFTFPKQDSIRRKGSLESHFYKVEKVNRVKNGAYFHGFEEDMLVSTRLSLLKKEDSSATAAFLDTILTSRASNLVTSVTVNLNIQNTDTVVIPNGRFLWEKLLTNWAEKQGLSTFFYEDSLLPDRIFLSTHAPTDLSSMRQAFREQKKISAEHQLQSSWLAGRNVEVDVVYTHSRKKAFFTSSSDEYWALGREWHNVDWKHQYEAFGSILNRVDPSGKNSVLRVHPNLMTKSVGQLFLDNKRLRRLRRLHPDLMIIPPHSKSSSYLILNQAETVVTTLSTIGLEASAMGKHVVLTNPSHYSEPLDLPVLENDLAVDSYFTKIASNVPSVEEQKVSRYFQFMLEQTIPLHRIEENLAANVFSRILIAISSPIDSLVMVLSKSRSPINQIVSRLLTW